MTSASRMVDNRCAITKLVRPLINSSIAFVFYFRMRIYIAGSFIQDHNFRIRCKGSCNRQKLTFTLGNIFRSMLQNHIISSGKRFYKAMSTRRLCTGYHSFPLHVLLCITNIFRNCSLKQPGILQNHSKSTSQFFSGHFSNIHSIYQNFSAINFIKSHQQVDQCCFPAPVGPTIATFCPGFIVTSIPFINKESGV